jgi:hypothetical protein
MTQVQDLEPTVSEGRKEACKTYLEQTKLLVTLASAFLFAPAGLVAILKDSVTLGLSYCQLVLFIAVESLFIISVLAGYVAVGALAGSQWNHNFDVYRPATRVASLIQFFAYLFALIVFLCLGISLLPHGRR